MMADEDETHLEKLQHAISEVSQKMDLAWPILKPLVALRENKIILAVILGLIVYINSGVVADWVKPIIGALI